METVKGRRYLSIIAFIFQWIFLTPYPHFFSDYTVHRQKARNHKIGYEYETKKDHFKLFPNLNSPSYNSYNKFL